MSRVPELPRTHPAPGGTAIPTVDLKGDESGVVAPRSAWAFIAVALALAISLVIWFALLEQRSLWEPDEGRYAEIPREMVASGDWITPRLNDLLYFEKPALQYWATAAAFEAFGLHNWTARLWCALSGLAGVMLAFYAGWRLHSMRAGVYAGAMLASSLLYFGLAHLNTLDMGLTFFLEVVVFAVAIGLRNDTSAGERKAWMHLAWLAAALAVLSKGLVGLVLPIGAMGAYVLLARDWASLSRLSLLTGGALFLLVSAPWFVAVSRANPDFAQFFFIHEHFTRYTTNQHHRGQPVWFFVPIVLLGALPWTWPMLSGLWLGLKNRAGAGFRPFLFLAVWSGAVFGFFSVSGSKLVPYILPIFPALAVLGARVLCEATPKQVARQVFWPAIIFGAFLVAAPWVLTFFPQAFGGEVPDAITFWSPIAGGLWGLGAVAARMLPNTFRVETGVIVLAVMVMTAHQIVLLGADQAVPRKSSVVLARQIKPFLGDSTRVYVVQMYPQSLPVYLERTVTLVESRGELDFGITRAPEKYVPTVERFLALWGQEKDAIAVMTKAKYREFETAGVPMTLIGQDTVNVAVRRP